MNAVDPKGLASYVGWESHFILGYGETTIRCCDEQKKKWIHRYKKVCLGAAVDFSLAGGTVSNSDGKSCSNPPKKLLGGEFGFGGEVFGVEGGGAVGLGGEGASGSGGGGVGVGIAKVTGCYYWLYISEYTGEDCCE